MLNFPKFQPALDPDNTWTQIVAIKYKFVNSIVALILFILYQLIYLNLVLIYKFLMNLTNFLKT